MSVSVLPRPAVQISSYQYTGRRVTKHETFVAPGQTGHTGDIPGWLMAVFDGSGDREAILHAKRRLSEIFSDEFFHHARNMTAALNQTMRRLRSETLHYNSSWAAAIAYVPAHRRCVHVLTLGNSGVLVGNQKGVRYISPENDSADPLAEAVTLSAHGFVLVATDGLWTGSWDMDSALGQTIRSIRQGRSAFDLVGEAVNQRFTHDNVTAILWRT